MPPPAGSDFEHLKLGDSGERIEVRTSHEIRQACITMAGQATQSLAIVSRDLDARVYDDLGFIEAVKELVIGSNRAEVRILVQNTGPIIATEHRLVHLARRLTSFVHMRVPAKVHAQYNHAFLVADMLGVVYRPLADRYEGVVCFNDPGEARALMKTFDEIWELAITDSNLRELRI